MISVAVAIYNEERYLRECLLSIQNQSFEDIEVLMIDDGSTDSSRAIAEEFLSDNRFRYIYKPNGGLSSVRNRAIREAKGEYICFVDGDDIIDREHIFSMYKTAEKYNSKLVVSSFYRFLDGEALPEIKINLKNNCSIKLRELIEELVFDRKFHNYICIKLIKKELLNGIVFPEGRVFEDLSVIIDIVKKAGDDIAIDNNRTYFYRYNLNSITLKNANSPKKLLDSALAANDRIEQINTTNNDIIPNWEKSMLILWQKQSIISRYLLLNELYLLSDYGDIASEFDNLLRKHNITKDFKKLKFIKIKNAFLMRFYKFFIRLIRCFN